MLESSRRQTIAAHDARREAYLKAREDDKERRRREALRRIAPGFEPAGGLLVPVRVGSTDGHADQHAEGAAPRKDVMDDLVNQLERLEGKTS
ncbi:hypothetical protein EVG20_g11399 [Dentipellis fragilis]|uniref:Uncharacterized protein n=1 Tax=Dentipellis fragilis TaxID=205917 RepID=A0A4Y9XLR3_9AGAM|nr:hypothetical protein EVG20_g11399 [Dentipellis fragilis]